MRRVDIDGNSCFVGNVLEVGLNAHLHVYDNVLALTRCLDDEVECTAIVEWVPARSKKPQPTTHTPTTQTDPAPTRPTLVRRLSQSVLSLLSYTQGAAGESKAPTAEQRRMCGNRHAVERKLVHMIRAAGCSSVTFHGAASGANPALATSPLVVDLSDSAALAAVGVALPRLTILAEGCTAISLHESSLTRGTLVSLSMEARMQLDQPTSESLDRGPALMKVVREATARVTLAIAPGAVPQGYREALADTPVGQSWHRKAKTASSNAQYGTSNSHPRRRTARRVKRRRSASLNARTEQASQRASNRETKRRRRE